MRLYILLMAVLSALLAAALCALTGCVGRAGTVQSGHDTETGTVRVATSGPVAEIKAEVKADVDAALVKTENKISSKLEAGLNAIQNNGMSGGDLARIGGTLASIMTIYMAVSKTIDGFFRRRERGRQP